MKERIKKCFETPKKMAVSIACIVAILVVLGAGSAYAATGVAKSSAIGEENAKNYAFADAGVDPTAAENVVVDFEFESGQFVYDVEFDANGSEYEYWIKASDGTVVKKDVEIVNLEEASTTTTDAATLTEDEAKEIASDDGATNNSNASSSYISVDEAKSIALGKAGLSASDVSFTKAKLEKDDGIMECEVEFYKGNTEYEVTINATTGAVIDYDVDYDD